jgi:hypothetical protein
MISTVSDLAAEALFASDLQPSHAPSSEAVRAAVTQTILRLGSEGCAASIAGEFGDHPDTAVRRMGWVRQILGSIYPMVAAVGEPQLQLVP